MWSKTCICLKIAAFWSGQKLKVCCRGVIVSDSEPEKFFRLTPQTLLESRFQPQLPPLENIQ